MGGFTEKDDATVEWNAVDDGRGRGEGKGGEGSRSVRGSVVVGGGGIAGCFGSFVGRGGG